MNILQPLCFNTRHFWAMKRLCHSKIRKKKRLIQWELVSEDWAVGTSTAFEIEHTENSAVFSSSRDNYSFSSLRPRLFHWTQGNITSGSPLWSGCRETQQENILEYIVYMDMAMRPIFRYFWYKSIRQRSLTQHFNPFRFGFEFAKVFVIKKIDSPLSTI